MADKQEQQQQQQQQTSRPQLGRAGTKKLYANQIMASCSRLKPGCVTRPARATSNLNASSGAAAATATGASQLAPGEQRVRSAIRPPILRPACHIGRGLAWSGISLVWVRLAGGRKRANNAHETAICENRL